MTTKFRQLLEQVDIELSQPITDDAVSFIVNEEIELEVPVVEHSDGSITLAPDDFVYNFLSEEYTFEDEQGMAEARHISAGADNISSAKKLWQYVRRNLTDLASNAGFYADLNQLYIEDRLSNLFKTADGQQVKIAFTTGGGIKFDQGILYIPIGVMWYYRGMYTSESFVNGVINALNGKKGVEEAKNPEDFMNQLKGLGRRLPSQSTLDKVFNEYDYDRVGDNLWKALDRGDEKNTLRFINSYLDQGSAQAWWGDLQAIGVEIDLDDPEQSIFTWNKPLPTDDQQGVTEGKKPDYLDFDKDGDKKEPMTKALKNKKELKEGGMAFQVGDYVYFGSKEGKIVRFQNDVAIIEKSNGEMDAAYIKELSSEKPSKFKKFGSYMVGDSKINHKKPVEENLLNKYVNEIDKILSEDEVSEMAVDEAAGALARQGSRALQVFRPKPRSNVIDDPSLIRPAQPKPQLPGPQPRPALPGPQPRPALPAPVAEPGKGRLGRAAAAAAAAAGLSGVGYLLSKEKSSAQTPADTDANAGGSGSSTWTGDARTGSVAASDEVYQGADTRPNADTDANAGGSGSSTWTGDASTGGVAAADQVYQGADTRPNTVKPSSYQVAKGDTLSQIAQRNNTSVRELIKLNPEISNPDVLRAGQKINIAGALDSVYSGGVGTAADTQAKIAAGKVTPPSQFTGPGANLSVYTPSDISDRAAQRAGLQTGTQTGTQSPPKPPVQPQQGMFGTGSENTFDISKIDTSIKPTENPGFVGKGVDSATDQTPYSAPEADSKTSPEKDIFNEPEIKAESLDRIRQLAGLK